MSPLRSLQAKLIGSFVLVVAVAIAISSVLYVALRRDDQSQRELDRVAAAGPSIFGQFTVLNANGRTSVDLTQFVTEISAEHNVRVLLLGPTGEVALDSSHRLEGAQIEPPSETNGPWRRSGFYLRLDQIGRAHV